MFDIGCGEGGVAYCARFAERGCYCLGVDLDQSRMDLANRFFEKEVKEGKMEFLYKNILRCRFFGAVQEFIRHHSAERM